MNDFPLKLYYFFQIFSHYFYCPHVLQKGSSQRANGERRERRDSEEKVHQWEAPLCATAKEIPKESGSIEWQSGQNEKVVVAENSS